MPNCLNKSPEDIEFKNTHLIDRERLDVAMAFLVHEFSKLFPSLQREELKNQLSKLLPNNTSSDVKIRNFWNLCASIGIGFRLKNITKDFTNASIRWALKQVEISQLRPESPIGCLDTYFSMIGGKENFNYQDFVKYLRSDNSFLNSISKEMEHAEQGRNASDKSDPLIGIEISDDIIEIRDGNRRLLTTIIEQVESSPNSIIQSKKIDVWVGSQMQNNQNYWVPTGFMMIAEDMIVKGGKIDKTCIEHVIKKESEIGLIE